MAEKLANLEHREDEYDVIYSSTERKIGKWRNGKPLYEITLVSDTATTGSAVLTVGTIPNLAFGFIVSGWYANNSSDFGAIGSVFMLTNTGRDTATTSYTSYAYLHPDGRVMVLYGSTTASTQTGVTVRYTKTTD